MTQKDSGKDIVELEIYGTSSVSKYSGRLLGLLSPEEYAGLIKKPEVRNRLFTVETKKISEISEIQNVENMRLAIALKTKNDTPVLQKKLFFTESLDMLSHIVGENDITFIGKDGSYILLSKEQNKSEEVNE